MKERLKFYARSALTAFLTVMLLTYLSLGIQQYRDPLTRLEQATIATVPAQMQMPTRAPGALPATQARLDLVRHRMGATVEYVSMAPLHYGYVTYATRIIQINETLNADMRTQTLAHELAHLLQPPGFDKGDAEVWADSVAYLVVRAEDDRMMDSARYLAWHKGHLAVLTAYRKEILFAAALLRGEIE